MTARYCELTTYTYVCGGCVFTPSEIKPFI